MNEVERMGKRNALKEMKEGENVEGWDEEKEEDYGEEEAQDKNEYGEEEG